MSKPARAPEGEIAAFLGEGTEFQGTLTFEGTIRVDGKLSGEVISRDTLVVGEDAEVEAEINVGVLVCRGRVSGNVKASDRIELHETAELRGNISTGRLTITEGAVFHGSCEMPQAADKVTPITQPMQAVRDRIEGTEEGGEAEEAGSGP
ncbi:MAG: polymer-forming cytoskeletal protein [Nitrospinota bacterium]